MLFRLIVLYKKTISRPLGIGDAVRRLIIDAILKVTEEEITHTCGEYQLWGGLVTGIDGGGIHSMCLGWLHHYLEEEW